MRGLAFAVVDEADSVLIDEAVTPLIISGDAPNEEQVQAFQQAADISARLVKGKHYKSNPRYHEIELTDEGFEAVMCSRFSRTTRGTLSSPRTSRHRRRRLSLRAKR